MNSGILLRYEAARKDSYRLSPAAGSLKSLPYSLNTITAFCCAIGKSIKQRLIFVKKNLSKHIPSDFAADCFGQLVAEHNKPGVFVRGCVRLNIILNFFFEFIRALCAFCKDY